jgi:hypothetical protein
MLASLAKPVRLARLVTMGIVPRLPVAARPVPGPPKRFAPETVCRSCADLRLGRARRRNTWRNGTATNRE